MHEFDHIKSLWQSHSPEPGISAEEMLKQAKLEVNAIRRKSLLNIAGMLISLAAIATLLLTYDFKSWTAMLGVGIILLTVAIYTLLLYREHAMLSKQDFTINPSSFIERLKEYQFSRYQLYTRLYWFYPMAISAGMILYFMETFERMEPWTQLAIIVFSFCWMVFCATYLRKAFLKREKERLELLIEKFERISAQID